VSHNTRHQLTVVLLSNMGIGFPFPFPAEIDGFGVWGWGFNFLGSVLAE
jgi:hypothetical protein